MKEFSFSEFKPTFFFLLKFIGIYIVANLLYGMFVTHYEPGPDPITANVAGQTAVVLEVCSWPVEVLDNEKRPTTELISENKRILSVYEGCNGINVMIIFVAFLVAFGPINKTLAWFIPLGLLILHVINLLRISLLFWVALYRPEAMYFTHKYFFTAILYVVIFVLWMIWVRKFSLMKKVPA